MIETIASITVHSEHFATWALTVATVHLAHRSLPEERKHWLRQQAKRVTIRRNRDGDR